MDLHLLVDNLTNPALLFFFLGIIAVQLKSDLEIPAQSAKFISMYLLLSIGFKGGQELSHSGFNSEIIASLMFGVVLALAVPAVTFFILKKRLGVHNAGAISAAYGSVSAVTFVTSVSFLEFEKVEFGGHMVAVMALMEAPSIIIGMLLISRYDSEKSTKVDWKKLIMHSVTNGSVLLIIGSLIIGLLANEEQAEGIKPFTSYLFKGFLAVFLLDMGITSGRKLGAFIKNGVFPIAFALITPVLMGTLSVIIAKTFLNSPGTEFLFGILAASASYIAVPAAMKLAAPKANPGLYVPMALAVTFPLNITLGIPYYFWLAESLRF